MIVASRFRFDLISLGIPRDQLRISNLKLYHNTGQINASLSPTKLHILQRLEQATPESPPPTLLESEILQTPNVHTIGGL